MVWPQNFDSSGWLLQDVNSDGLTDLLALKPLSATSVQIHSFLSNGRQFVLTEAPVQLISGLPNVLTSGYTGNRGSARGRVGEYYPYSIPPKILSGEFNGDGRPDIVLATQPTTCQQSALAAGTCNTAPKDVVVIRSFAGGFDLETSRPVEMGYVSRVVDLNGDGLSDFHSDFLSLPPFMVSVPPNSGLPYVISSAGVTRGPIPDLLASIKQPLGGKTTVTYRSSAGLPDTRVPFVMQVVSSITTDDGRGQPGSVATTDFAYEGGRWDVSEKQFLGFRTVTATLPANAGETARPQQRLTYQQTVGCAGKVSKTENLDASGAVLAEVAEGFLLDTSVPYTCVNSSTESKTLQGTAVKTTRTERQFDVYGNVIREIDLGNKDVTGDEMTTWTSFAPNTADYLVACPMQSLTRAGANVATNPGLARKLVFYDGATSSSTPPTRCEATQERIYLTDTTVAATVKSYDVTGNVVSVTDPVGLVTTSIYDTATKLYVTETQSPKPGLSMKTQWDLVCGLPVKQAGYNATLAQTPTTGEVTTTSYDPLCRELRKDLPGGFYTIKSYVNFGLPTAQFVRTDSSPAGGQTAGRVALEYMDGFGRVYGTKTTGSDAATLIETSRSFTARGEVAAETAPYYTGASPQWTTYAYDQLDRLIKTTHPDGTFNTLSYALAPAASTDILEVTETDEGGKVQKYSLDADGKLTARTKMKGTTPLVTRYVRDVLGRVVSVTDPQLNTWAYTFDVGGRRTSVSDPDLGTWTYTYDAAGRLITQTDAKGQVTTLVYDPLSRVTSKTVTGAGLATETTSNTYDQVRAGFHNLGKLTTARRDVAAQTVASVPLAPVASHKTFDHDLAGRLVKETHIGIHGADRILETEYWPDGSLKRKRLADGTWTGTYTYDLAGRLASIDNANAASATEPDLFIQAIQYNARGQATSVTYGNGATAAYNYSLARGFMTGVTVTHAAATPLNLTYTRNAKGLITAITSPNAAHSWTYQYDAIDRLIAADNGAGTADDRTYAYDDADNLIFNSGLCAANPNLLYPDPNGAAAGQGGGAGTRPHAPIAICGTSVAYDANGNTLSYDVDGAGPQPARSLAYDLENRPIVITRNSLPAAMAYGADGERIAKSWNGNTVHFLGNDTELLVNAATPAGLLSSYMHPDVRREGTLTDFMIKDHLASTRVTLRHGPAATALHNHSPYGQPLTSHGSIIAGGSNAAITGGKGYINERFDPETGLQYLHFRYMDPHLARFITPDTWDPLLKGVDIN